MFRSKAWRSRLGFKIALQEDRRSDTIDDPFAFFSTDIGGDQQLFSRSSRHPLVPHDEGNRQDLTETVDEQMDGLHRRSFFTIEPQRQSDHDFSDIVRVHQLLNVRKIPIERPPLDRFKRLRGPPKLIAERDADPLGPVVEG